jgi:DNA-binding transcriptional regulator YiaG
MPLPAWWTKRRRASTLSARGEMGRRFREVREGFALTQGQVAAELGCSVVAVSRFELGTGPEPPGLDDPVLVLIRAARRVY